MDVICPTVELSKYDLVIAPSLHVPSDDVADNLRNYVRAGGALVVTPRTGVQDVAKVVVNQPRPGLLAELLRKSMMQLRPNYPRRLLKDHVTIVPYEVLLLI